jgi:hypothetical protein
MQNRLSAAVGAPTRGYHYDPHRYDGLADRAIAAALFRFVGVLLLRGRLQTLLARREIGGLLCEFAKHHPKDRPLFEAFALNTVGLSYDEGRRHIQLWVHWPLCEATLQRLQDEARHTRKPFVVPGLRKLLALTGVVGRRAAIALTVSPLKCHCPRGCPTMWPPCVQSCAVSCRRSVCYGQRSWCCEARSSILGSALAISAAMLQICADRFGKCRIAVAQVCEELFGRQQECELYRP